MSLGAISSCQSNRLLGWVFRCPVQNHESLKSQVTNGGDYEDVQVVRENYGNYQPRYEMRQTEQG